jgi:hypothetical protein
VCHNAGFANILKSIRSRRGERKRRSRRSGGRGVASCAELKTLKTEVVVVVIVSFTVEKQRMGESNIKNTARTKLTGSESDSGNSSRKLESNKSSEADGLREGSSAVHFWTTDMVFGKSRSGSSGLNSWQTSLSIIP